MKTHRLKSTNEVCHPLGLYVGSPLNPPHGYTDVIVPRSGMKRKKAVTLRVKNENLKITKA